MYQIQLINMVRSWDRKLEIENKNRENHFTPTEWALPKDVSKFEDMTQLFFERLSVQKKQASQGQLCCPEVFRQKTSVH